MNETIKHLENLVETYERENYVDYVLLKKEPLSDSEYIHYLLDKLEDYYHKELEQDCLLEEDGFEKGKKFKRVNGVVIHRESVRAYIRKMNLLKPYDDRYCSDSDCGEEMASETEETKVTIFDEIKAERERQDAKFGPQNRPILDQVLINRDPQRMCQEYEIPSETRAKGMVDIHAKRGDLTFMHILVEEISEAASCGNNVEALRKELIQCAAVVVAMIESLDRNGK